MKTYLNPTRPIQHQRPLSSNMPMQFAIPTRFKTHINTGHLGGVGHNICVFLTSPSRAIKSKSVTHSLAGTCSIQHSTEKKCLPVPTKRHRPLRINRLPMIRVRRSQLITIQSLVFLGSCASLSSPSERNMDNKVTHTRTRIRPSFIPPNRLRLVNIFKLQITPIIRLLLLPGHQLVLHAGILDGHVVGCRVSNEAF